MKKRIFAAIEISERARTTTADYIENLRGEFSQIRVGWEKPEKLHLTLKFFGDVEENKLPKLIEAVGQATRQLSTFRLQISETGIFPSIRQPKILWLGVRDEPGSLAMTNNLLETHCEQAGFAKEQRSFKPHLTIARLREPRNSIELARVHLRNEYYSEIFKVGELIVFESQFTVSGSRYAPIFRAQFHKPDLQLTSN